MMKAISVFLVLLILYSCNPKISSNTQANRSDGFVIKPLKTEYYQFDTARLNHPVKISTKWSDYADFFSVYRISPNLIGIAIDINNTNDPLGELVKRYADPKTDDSHRDISGPMHLRKSSVLQDYLFLRDTSRTFYLYCLRGRTLAHIVVIFYEKTEDECTSNIVFSLSEIDTAKYGTPLIASKKKLDLIYGKLPGFDEDMEKYETYKNQLWDFPDDYYSRQFAYNKELIMTFKDDFLWYKGKIDYTSKLSFPGRSIYSKKDRKIKIIWGDSLDLIGVPCI